MQDPFWSTQLFPLFPRAGQNNPLVLSTNRIRSRVLRIEMQIGTAATSSMTADELNNSGIYFRNTTNWSTERLADRRGLLGSLLEMSKVLHIRSTSTNSRCVGQVLARLREVHPSL